MSNSTASNSPNKKKKPLPYFMERTEEAALPSFQNRRTLADHVKDNMLCAGRKSYFQRIVYVGRHPKVTGMTLRDRFLKLIKELQECTVCEIKLFGLMINFDGYTVHMVESAEETVGEYLRTLAAADLFEESRVVLVYNNINQRLFRKLVWRVSDYLNELKRTELDQRDPNLTQGTINAFLVQVYQLCKMHTPDIAVLEYLLGLKCLFTVPEYASFYGRLPDVSSFPDRVWPIPKDLTPYDVFEAGKYDVNLTFGGK
ncbi:AGAP005994-PA [Anopheles gambiae str. PEST]|uniref:AGAP005994-PA n=1 Tax=Anopheles gambiae TaxID=7165 RepID=A7UU01_ANOGA|nr:AGAP005994-PA [Anopheles gambiae str. PEST]